MYCHFSGGIGDPKYMPVTSIESLTKILVEALESYNELNAAMNLVLFIDAVAHILRIKLAATVAVRVCMRVCGHVRMSWYACVGMHACVYGSICVRVTYVCVWERGLIPVVIIVVILKILLALIVILIPAFTIMLWITTMTTAQRHLYHTNVNTTVVFWNVREETLS